uniref:Cell division cycle protein 27 homolog n=1 Tax=Phlebotomus papatasi TaxID=29031 RepID=A0A1B0GM77_PHLPP
MDETPRLTPGSETLGGNEAETPLKKQFKYLSSISPITPSFGVLPLNSSTEGGSPGLVGTPGQTLVEVNDQKGSGKKKGTTGQCVINRKEGPLQQTKPMLNNQTGNYPSRPQQTPGGGMTGQSVRRSSRLFSSSYSVKENSKSSQNINKFVTPRSPSRKTKTQRISIINATLDERKMGEKEKVETVTSAESKVLLNNSINAAQSLLAMKRQSAEGLLQLLRELGQGYLQLSQYNTREAIEHFGSVPTQHYTSSWVQSMIALAWHEQRDYEKATKIFKEIHEREPHRLHLMEVYSTALWALQREVSLSALAQDLMGQDKNSPIPWCVAGNCFSLHKEHEIAIKFFERAVQVDPEFVYSYTLLGHEFVITEELEKAMSSFRTAIVKNHRHYNAWFGIGTIYSKQERHGHYSFL